MPTDAVSGMTETEGLVFFPKPIASAHIFEAIVAPALTDRFIHQRAKTIGEQK
jgi:hypothetical protein